jgi:hypothetical protein
MEEFGPHPSRFSTMARLFSLVDQLPRSRQLSLLAQLLGERITRHLCQLVLEMSDAERQRLIEQLAEAPLDPAEVTTIDLDEEDAPLRQLQRKACHLRAVCVLDAGTFDGTITDISTVGLYLRTEKSYPVGKRIRVSCRLPGREKALILSGDIIRSEAAGIGVRLDALQPEQDRAIRAFIDSPEPGAH